MKITWLGHSCFILESGGFRALLDPYHEVPGLPDTEAEADAEGCSARPGAPAGHPENFSRSPLDNGRLKVYS